MNVGWLTAALDAQEARQLALAALLLLVGQQLVDELPDELLGRSVQHGEHVNDQSVHVPSTQATRNNNTHSSTLKPTPPPPHPVFFSLSFFFYRLAN